MANLGFISDAIDDTLGFVFDPIFDAIKDWLTPDVQPFEGLTVQRTGSNVAIPVVYGTRDGGAIIVDKNVHGDDSQYFSVLGVLSYGEVDDVEEFFFNDISWTDDRWKNESGDFAYTYEVRKGGSDNNTAMSLGDDFNNWTAATSKYDGLCVFIFRFEQFNDESIWGGEPSITARVKGKKCLDWRTSTTAYTENPVVHLIDYIKSNVYGLGIPDSLIDYDSATLVANMCDDAETSQVTVRECGLFTFGSLDYTCRTVTKTTKGFARFSQNTIIDTGQQVFDNVKTIAKSYRGFFPDNDGLFSIATESEANSVFSFNHDNIIGAISYNTTSKNDRYNQVTVKFPNIENNYEMDEVSYPETGSTQHTTWLADDNGNEQSTSLTSQSIVYKAEALQLAEVAAKVSRNSDTISFNADYTAAELEVGDVFDITSETAGFDGTEFRVVQMSINKDGTVSISGRFHNDSVYPWVDQDYTEYVGGSNLGNPNDISAPSGLSLLPDTTLSNVGLLTWVHDASAFTREYLVKAIKGGEEVLSQPANAKSFTIPLLDAGSYEIKVYAVSTLGKNSAAGTLSFSLTAPVTPTNLELEPSDWEVYVKPVLAGAGLGTVFDFDYVVGDGVGYTPEPLAQGYNHTFAGLIPDTLHTFYCRSVNAYGISDWFSKSATTTNEGAQVSPFLDALQNEIDNVQNEIDGLGVATLPFTINDIASTSESIIDLWNNQLRLDEIKTTDGVVEATVTRLDKVEIDSDGNTSAVSALLAGVTGETDTAAAYLSLESYFGEGGVGARAWFGVDVNDRVTGINVEGQVDNGNIDFIADKVRFISPVDFSVKMEWSDADNQWTFNGKVIAIDSTFTGTITGSIINGGAITGAIVQTATSGQRVTLSGTEQRFYPATGSDYVSLDGEAIGGSYSGDYITITPSGGQGGLQFVSGTSFTTMQQTDSRFIINSDSLGVGFSYISLNNNGTFGMECSEGLIEVSSSEFYCFAPNGFRVYSSGSTEIKSDGNILLLCDDPSTSSSIKISKNNGTNEYFGVEVREGGSSTVFGVLCHNSSDSIIATASGVTVIGTVTETSDPTLKDFKRELDGEESLQMICETNLYEYTFKDQAKYGSGLQVGVDAVQAGSVFANSISMDDDELLGFNYRHAYIHGLSAIKELNNKVERLENLVSQLLAQK